MPWIPTKPRPVPPSNDPQHASRLPAERKQRRQSNPATNKASSPTSGASVVACRGKIAKFWRNCLRKLTRCGAMLCLRANVGVGNSRHHSDLGCAKGKSCWHASSVDVQVVLALKEWSHRKRADTKRVLALKECWH